MAMPTLSSVPADEAAPFYQDYLAAFPDGRVGIHLPAQAVELEELCAGLTESGAMFRYAEGKWTIKEVIGHLLDTERVFAYRLLRISRGDVTELPGFDETTYAPEGQFNLRGAEALISVQAAASEHVGTREWHPSSRMASCRDCEWFSYERSRTRLHHSRAHRASL
jgi:hypothetical protein